MKKILKVLFYPWISAHFQAAYLCYCQSDFFIKKFNWGGKSACVRHFLDYHIDDFLVEAFERYWPQIIFTPWIFKFHEDFDGEKIS